MPKTSWDGSRGLGDKNISKLLLEVRKRVLVSWVNRAFKPAQGKMLVLYKMSEISPHDPFSPKIKC